MLLQAGSAVMRHAGWLFALCALVAFAAGTQGELQGSTQPLHLNLKEIPEFSPETVADVEQVAIEKRYYSHTQNTPEPFSTRNKGDWKSMGTWESDASLYDVTISDVVFNLWWVEDPNDEEYDANLELRWTLFLDGQQIFQYEDNEDDNDDDGYEDGTGPCPQTRDDPCEYAEPPTGTFPSTLVERGLTISLEVEMKSFRAIYIYYDNASRDSGMKVAADAVFFGRGTQGSGEVGFEYLEAWKTDANEILKGNFLTLTVDGATLDNNAQPSGYPRVEEGVEYQLNNATVKAVMVFWKLEQYARGDDPTVGFAYTSRADHAPAIMVDIGSLGQISTGEEANSGFLGLPGFELVMAALVIALTARRRR
jgi:hypothetical protein